MTTTMATTNLSRYQPVVFEGKKGSLSISPDGVLFEEEGHVGEGAVSTSSVGYQRRVPWKTVRKHRVINMKTEESQASIRLWVEEDYGEGMEQETLVFGMQDRKQLERFNKDMLSHLRPTNAEEDQSTTQVSISSASITMSKVQQEPPHGNTNLTTSHQDTVPQSSTLTLLIYKHLVRESRKVKKHLSPDGCQDNELGASGHDEVELLRTLKKSIQQEETEEDPNETSFSTLGESAAAAAGTMGIFARMVAEQLHIIQEDKSRNNSRSNSHNTDPTTDHTLLPSTIPREVDTDATDCLSRRSGISCAAVSDGLEDSARHSQQHQLRQLSVPQVNEPEKLVVTNNAKATISAAISADDGSAPPATPEGLQHEMGQDALICLARQLDEQDSQAKRRAAASGEQQDPAASMGPARYSRRRSRARNDRLKEQLVLQLALESSQEQELSPGAYHVTSTDNHDEERVVHTMSPSCPPTTAPVDRTSRSSTQEDERRQQEATDTVCGGGRGMASSSFDVDGHGNSSRGPISNGQLIEAHLVAQQSSSRSSGCGGRAEETLEDKRSDLLAAIGAAHDFPQRFWDMTDTEFLDALSNVIASRPAQAATTSPALPSLNQQDDNRRDIDLPAAARRANQSNVVAAAVLRAEAASTSPVTRATVVEAPMANRMTRKDEEEPEAMRDLPPLHPPSPKTGGNNDASFCCYSDAANASIREVNC